MYIQAFMSQFQLPNQKIATIKWEIVSIFTDLQNEGVIHSRFILIPEIGIKKEVNKLSNLSLTKYNIICFYEKIYPKQII